MDPDAWRIRELAAETCAALHEAVRCGWDDARLGELELAAGALSSLAAQTDDDEAADAGRGVVAEVEALLAHAIDPLLARGAA